jgi:DNA end-binding protein Ku
MEIVEKKVAGEEIEIVEAPEETKVVDLMEALKQSVESTKKQAGAKSSGRKAAGRKKAAS